MEWHEHKKCDVMLSCWYTQQVSSVQWSMRSSVRKGVCVDGAKAWSCEVMTPVVYGADVLRAFACLILH